MPRYFIHLSFDGTRYHGWQIQENAFSVQQQLNESLCKILQEEISTIGCGRTDTGVHATNFYVHFDSVLEEITENLIFKLNCVLPKDIAIYNITRVKEDAHARFDAFSRSYEYYLHTQKDPFKIGKSYYKRVKLDLDKMNEAAQLLLKHSDFTCFSKSRTQVKTNICTITNAVFEKKDESYVFKITANRFLRGMVRAIVGTLLEVGEGKLSSQDFEQIILSKDRKKAGESVDPCGLYLTDVKYPSTIF